LRLAINNASLKLPDRFFKNSQAFLDENSLCRVPHLSYSPDLTPSDFCLFDHMKATPQRRKFEAPEQLLDGIHDFLNEMQSFGLIFVFHY
jgi:hypothetical protein